MTLCELGGESPTLRSTQNCGCEQSSGLWLCFLVSPWDDAWFFWGVLWLCRCFMALNCLQRSCEWGLARHRGCGMFSRLYFFQHYWECPSWWEKKGAVSLNPLDFIVEMREINIQLRQRPLKSALATCVGPCQLSCTSSIAAAWIEKPSIQHHFLKICLIYCT